jgi:LysM repeat protein
MNTRSKKFSAGMLFVAATLLLGACGDTNQSGNLSVIQPTAPAATVPATTAPATTVANTAPTVTTAPASVTTTATDGTATALDEPMPEELAKTNQAPDNVELVQNGVPKLQAQNVNSNSTFVYVVVRGDTLSTIAWSYGTTVGVIAQANGLTNPNLIYAGQRLVIPGGQQPDTTPDLFYIVQSGDTVSAIARRFGTTVKAIVDANDIADPNVVRVGQRLLIPGASNPGNVTKIYVIQRGDTLSGIAAYYGTTVQKLVSDNHLANPNRIYVGQRLTIIL